MSDPQWLVWARELQAIAQNGLTFSTDPYDRERFEALRRLAAEIFAAGSTQPVEAIESLFALEAGYTTPKIDVRGAVFDTAGRLLMVREASDRHRWTLPGGWADVNLSAGENVVKEVREESGYDVRAVKIAAAWDRTRQGHPPTVFSCAKLFYLCELLGGEARTSLETSEVAWFARDALPTDLSLGRVLPRQLHRLFDHRADPSLPTDFD